MARNRWLETEHVKIFATACQFVHAQRHGLCTGLLLRWDMESCPTMKVGCLVSNNAIPLLVLVEVTTAFKPSTNFENTNRDETATLTVKYFPSPNSEAF